MTVSLEDKRMLRLWLSRLALLVVTGLVLVMAYQRRWVDDDGFINLRIIRNLLNGYGPVFNLDERVEAGTSPLWLALLTLLVALGAHAEDASVYLGIAFTAASVLVAASAASRLYTGSVGIWDARCKHAFFPLGALVIAALPPIWDYATAGLETGLSLFWLAAGYGLVVSELVRSEPVARGRQLAAACLLGLGILIRPDLTLYALGFFVLFAALALQDQTAWRAKVGYATSLMLSFGALPFVYQLFRMGYYGALSPNTAVAKEAFLVNWAQGACYLRNLLRPYKLQVALWAASVPLAWAVRDALPSLRERAPGWPSKAQLRLLTLLLPLLIAVVHTTYVVRMGGDYMHGRMLLPPLFAALLPVAMVPLDFASKLGASLTLLSATVVTGWAVICASSLRVAEANVCDIGDERGWYAREAKVANPVRLAEYDKHQFVGWGRGLLDSLHTTCPQLDDALRGDVPAGCRIMRLSDDDAREVYPARTDPPLDPTLDPRLLGVVSQGAVGITGYMLPSRVHLIDIHGLADPFVARAQLTERGRPGHEKTLPTAWHLARFTVNAGASEDASIAAARHALRCGALAELTRAVREPLDLASFFRHIVEAPKLTRLRIPRDPFEAEAQFCGGSSLFLQQTAGNGGDQFTYRCPNGGALTGVSGSFDTPSAAIAQVQARCGLAELGAKDPLTGPAFGPGSDTPFELQCAPGTRVVGVFGTSERVVNSLGLLCAAEGAASETRTAAAGLALGNPFELRCAAGQRVRGLRGRAGALLDAMGIACSL